MPRCGSGSRPDALSGSARTDQGEPEQIRQVLLGAQRREHGEERWGISDAVMLLWEVKSIGAGEAVARGGT